MSMVVFKPNEQTHDASNYAPINVSTNYPPYGEGWGFEGD